MRGLYAWSNDKDGPFSEEAFKKKLENLGYRVSRYSYPPGTYFPDHEHAVDKIDAVLAGKFRMKTREGEVILKKGDFLVVPKGTIHSAETLGEETVISFDCVKKEE